MGFIGLLRTLEQITRPPRMGHDLDLEDGAEQTDCLVPEDFNAACRCVACVAEERAAEDELAAAEEVSEPEDDSLACPYPDCARYVDHRGPHEFPWGDSIPWPPEADNDYDCTCPSWGNPNWPHRHGCPADPHKSSASNHTGTGAEPNPSPTIVQSAPPPTVDGEGPASVRDIQPSPEAGRPTSELLTEAADFLSIHASRTESGEGARAYIRDTLLPEIDARAATFKAIEE